MKRILIVKTSSLGDIIHAFPVVSYLKKKIPDCDIDWVVEKGMESLVSAHPQVSRAILIDSKKWRKWERGTFQQIKAFRRDLQSETYDLLIDLQGNTKSSFVTFLAKAKSKVGFGWKSVPEWPNLLVTNTRFNPPQGKNIREDYLFLIQSHLKDNSFPTIEPISLRLTQIEEEEVQVLYRPGKNGIMVCPGAAWINKQVPEVQLIQILNALPSQDDPFFYFLWGSDEERGVAIRLHAHFAERSLLLPRLSLPVLQRLMDKMKLVVSMDSLPLHLAGTTKTPTLGFFGPSNASKYAPIGPQHRTLQGICPYRKHFDKRCPILRTCPDAPCIKNFTLDSH